MKSYKENWKKLIGIGVVALAALLVLIGIEMVYHEKVKKMPGKEIRSIILNRRRRKRKTGRSGSLFFRLWWKRYDPGSYRRCNTDGCYQPWYVYHGCRCQLAESCKRYCSFCSCYLRRRI